MNRLRKRYGLSRSQKLMVFIVSMSLYGLSTMIAEVFPVMSIGPIVLSAKYFAFIPLILCMLFHPLYAAIGAAMGQFIFSGILFGQIGGLSELEQFVSLSIAMVVAGSIVKDPRNRKQIAVGAITGALIHHGIGSMADIQQVLAGAADLEALPGLAGIVIIIEVFSFVNAILISGLLFGLLPALYLVPRLTGRIEPLLGMQPRRDAITFYRNNMLGPR